jgi:tetratricopeptide (TPR) repeat protein
VTVAWQAELNAIVQRAKVARDAGQWRNAIALYAKANEIDGVRYDIKHNLALSLIAVNRVDDGLLYLSHALALKPDLWPSHVLKAKVMRGRGLVEEADSVLTHILKHDPRNGHALLAAADLDMNEFGDAVGARERVAPLLSDPAFKGEAELTTLMSKLYDRDESDEELSYMLMDFAKRELSMPGFTFSVEAMAGVANRTGRKRVGLLSPMFCASPVYFLTILTFRQLAKSFDLIILNKSLPRHRGRMA